MRGWGPESPWRRGGWPATTSWSSQQQAKRCSCPSIRSATATCSPECWTPDCLTTWWPVTSTLSSTRATLLRKPSSSTNTPRLREFLSATSTILLRPRGDWSSWDSLPPSSGKSPTSAPFYSTTNTISSPSPPTNSSCAISFRIASCIASIPRA